MNEGFSFAKLWDEIVTFFTTKYWNIISFFLVLLAGILIIKTLLTIIKRAMRRGKMERIAQSFILNILRYVLYLVLLLILLSMIGVQISGIITALSAALLAVGMALKDSIANLASGIIIVSMKMIRKGDFISADGTDGTVEDINFLFTTLKTPDNKKVFIPNGTVTKSSLYNYGINGSRRVDFTFSVSYDADVELVKKIVTDVMYSCDKAATDPAPFCRLKTLSGSSLDFFANCWCNSDDYWTVYYYVTETVFNEFKKQGVSIPYPQSEVRIRNDQVVMPVIDETPVRTAPEFKITSKEEKDEFEFIKKVKEKADKKIAKKKGKSKKE
ncbi:MAG: mechanosensitive ion channel [Clostridia bacterium]|nr:mechanosensitive ion channel [Clostridia bacterium]